MIPSLSCVLTEFLHFCSRSSFLSPPRGAFRVQASLETHVLQGYLSPAFMILPRFAATPASWHPPDVGITQVPSRAGVQKCVHLPQWKLCLPLATGHHAALGDSRPSLATSTPSPRASPLPLMSDPVSTALRPTLETSCSCHPSAVPLPC
jgi:hypothetical protein